MWRSDSSSARFFVAYLAAGRIGTGYDFGHPCGAVERRGPMATRILIADDDATIRMLLRRLLERQPDWQVCGDAANGVEAIEKVEQLQPDVLVMDLSMAVLTGLQA